MIAFKSLDEVPLKKYIACPNREEYHYVDLCTVYVDDIDDIVVKDVDLEKYLSKWLEIKNVLDASGYTYNAYVLRLVALNDGYCLCYPKRKCPCVYSVKKCVCGLIDNQTKD
ncbi:MAG: hypothetical protein QXW41_08045 [Fervidicoccaceae archaeon]